jgi:hypothetical protein
VLLMACGRFWAYFEEICMDCSPRPITDSVEGAADRTADGAGEPNRTQLN